MFINRLLPDISFWAALCIVGIISWYWFKQDFCVFNCFCHNPHLVQTWCHRLYSVSWNSSIRWFKSYNPAKWCWLADAPSGISSQSCDAEICSYRCSTSATRTSWYTVNSVRVDGFSKVWCLGTRAHRKFIHVGLPDHQPSVFLEGLKTGRTIRTDKILHHLRPTRSNISLCQNNIFDSNRRTMQRFTN